jgi:tRNA dimethylallyltransferase
MDDARHQLGALEVMTNNKQTVVVLGPTAGGKSELAVELAELLHRRGEPLPGVIGADSMQVYRHLDAGTAKPSRQLRARVPHHMIDIVEPTQSFTVHDWLRRVQPLIADLRQQDTRAIVVGGTNLYIKALLSGLFEGPGQDTAFRASLAGTAPPLLHERLQKVDPAAASRIDPNDRKRLIRALEVHHLTGRPISEYQTQWRETRNAEVGTDKFAMVGLQWPVEEINHRINLRVKAMFHPDQVAPEVGAEICPNGESLPQEAARLNAAGLLGNQAREALGYKQVLASFRGEMTMEEAFERTKIETRRFAKQQRTWMKRFTGVKWIEATETPRDQWSTIAADAAQET